MPGAVVWFALVLGSMLAAWYAGFAVTRIQDPLRRGGLVAGAVLLLFGWAVLIRYPAIAVELIPLPALARLEGIGAAPLFLFIVSAGWQLAVFKRQRAVMALGALLGIAYFLQGGLWMMRPTPTRAFSQTQHRLVVRQTQDYSCVPAASATALRMLHQRSDEAEMAKLTETRAGSGATLLRALNGLDKRLKHTGIMPRLIEPDYDQLQRLEPPLLTPMQYAASRLHMVTIVEARPHMVVIADPASGIEFQSRHQFLSAYRGQVIAFDGGGPRAKTKDVLAQFPHMIDPDLADPIASAQTTP